MKVLIIGETCYDFWIDDKAFNADEFFDQKYFYE